MRNLPESTGAGASRRGSPAAAVAEDGLGCRPSGGILPVEFALEAVAPLLWGAPLDTSLAPDRAAEKWGGMRAGS